MLYSGIKIYLYTKRFIYISTITIIIINKNNNINRIRFGLSIIFKQCIFLKFHSSMAPGWLILISKWCCRGSMQNGQASESQWHHAAKWQLWHGHKKYSGISSTSSLRFSTWGRSRLHDPQTPLSPDGRPQMWQLYDCSCLLSMAAHKWLLHDNLYLPFIHKMC